MNVGVEEEMGRGWESRGQKDLMNINISIFELILAQYGRRKFYYQKDGPYGEWGITDQDTEEILSGVKLLGEEVLRKGLVGKEVRTY